MDCLLFNCFIKFTTVQIKHNLELDKKIFPMGYQNVINLWIARCYITLNKNNTKS